MRTNKNDSVYTYIAWEQTVMEATKLYDEDNHEEMIHRFKQLSPKLTDDDKQERKALDENTCTIDYNNLPESRKPYYDKAKANIEKRYDMKIEWY